MARDMKVGLTFETEDKVSPTIRRITGEAARQAERTAQRSARAATDAQRTQEQAAVRQQSAQERVARAREQLGVRSERAIRREIQLTEAAYNRLARSGRASVTEQSRAYAQMQQRVAGLRQEMAGLERQQRRGVGSTMVRAGSMLLSAGAPIAAAGAVISRPVGRVMDYDQRLRYMANTAFSDNGQQGREQGYKALKDAVDSTIQKVGGNRDEAAGALSKMLNDGTLTGEQALRLLPNVQAVAVGQGANAQDVGGLVNALVKTGGISVEDIPRALDQVVKATKEGPIEFAELVRDMPRILGRSGQVGLSGIENLPALLSAIENSMATAGSAGEGMNNVYNWLSKLNSQDAIRSAAKIEIAPGESIDLVPQLAAYRAAGMNMLQGYDAIVDRIVAADPNVARVEKQLRNANPADRVKMLQSQQAIFSGSAISQLLPDSQALMGYLSYRYMDKDKRARQISSIENSQGANAEDLEFIKAGPSFKAQQGKNAWQAVEFKTFKDLANNIGDLSGKMAGLAAEYPGLAQAVVATKTALEALAYVAGSTMLLSALRNRGAAGAEKAGIDAAAGAAGAAAGGSKFLRIFGRVGVAGPVVAGIGAYGAYQVATDDSLSSGQKTDQYIGLGSKTIGTWAGMRAGAVTGAWAGAMTGPLAPVATPVGALIGGVAGGFAGNYLGDELAQYLQGLRSTSSGTPMPISLGFTPEEIREAVLAGQREANQEPRKLDVNVTVDVQGGNITAEVNRVNERESRRH